MKNVDFCELFYASHYLPIALYENGRYICSSGFYNDSDPYAFVLPRLENGNSPAIYVSSDSGYYGAVRNKNGKQCYILGPVYTTAITETIIRTFMRKNAISMDRYDEIGSFLNRIPRYSYNQFMNLLLFLHYSLTGERLTIDKAFDITDEHVQSLIGQIHSERSYDARDEGISHGTYHFEQMMLGYIRNGETEELRNLLISAAGTPNSREGILAETPLRQAKNVFIGLVTMVGKHAAIPGGLEVEQTYQLIDTYIQECEKMQNEEAVRNLQYNMLIDFTNRVAKNRIPQGVSQEIFECMQFISSHINEPIKLNDVVSYSERSRAGLCQKFSEEVGISIGAYITEKRIQEAQSLLKFTDKPLSEIGAYLCFSSQSHFQSTFKRITGLTPLEYRKSAKTVGK